MIVIAIIMILVTIAIVAGESARKVARDNQRKTDITLIQLKLQSYFDIAGKYPSSLNVLVNDNTIPYFPLPHDPLAGHTDYQYFNLRFAGGIKSQQCMAGIGYYLYATLENNTVGTHPTINNLLPCDTYPPPNSPNIYDVTSPNVFSGQ